jgi:hypothetical protein
LSDRPYGYLRATGSPPLGDRPTRDTERLASTAAFAAGVLEGRATLDVTIPRAMVNGAPVVGRMRLLTRAEAKEVRHATRLALRELGLDEAATSPAPERYAEFHEEIVTRTLATAIRCTDVDAPLAPLEEWTLCADDQLDALWARYQDLAQSVDPIGRTLDESLVAAIRDAAKKKEVAILISYGSSALASYAITTADPPST